jgi:VCBS repeat protein/FG-GAP repeat protein
MRWSLPILLVGAFACGDSTPTGPTTYVVSGQWYFSEHLSAAQAAVSCGDGGPVLVTQSDRQFAANGVVSGACTGPGGTQTYRDVTTSIESGTISGTQFRFVIDGCPYVGTAYGDAPDSVAGTAACDIAAGAGTVHVTGTWVVLPYSDTLAFGWDLGAAQHYTSGGMSLGKTIIGDVNGDGRQDVVAIQAGGSGQRILIYHQNQAGALAQPETLTTTGLAARWIAIGDLNGDGKRDLAVSGSSTTALSGYLGRVFVYLQNPATGVLQAPVEDTVASNQAYDVAIGDLDNDGDDDLVVGAEWVFATTGRLSIRYQGSGGTLGPEVLNDSVLVSPTGELHIADVTGDGRNDIIAQSGQLELAVIAQQANGTLKPIPARYAVQTSYWPQFDAFGVGDLNGDGRNDVVVLDPGNSGYLNFLYQTAAGTLARSLSPPLTTTFFGLEVGDVDRDGLADILGDASAVVGVLNQQADHTFPTVTPYGFQPTSFGGSLEHQSLAFGDVTGDGRPDAVVSWANEGVWVLPAIPVWGPLDARAAGSVSTRH